MGFYPYIGLETLYSSAILIEGDTLVEWTGKNPIIAFLQTTPVRANAPNVLNVPNVRTQNVGTQMPKKRESYQA